MVLSRVMLLYSLSTFSWGSCGRSRQTRGSWDQRGDRQGARAWETQWGKERASHVGILAGVDDLALPVHDAVDRDPRDDIGLDEF